MNCGERRSHARSVYPTQYTSRMGTAKVKQEVGADTKIIVKEYRTSILSKHFNRKITIHIEW